MGGLTQSTRGRALRLGSSALAANDGDRRWEPQASLSRTWEYTVLLDEAEVFPERRSLNDPKPSALVPVFLRVLVYRDGTIIATSDRVGKFDDAFKSRMQLALHYEKLDRGQRRQARRNFLNHLKSLGAGAIDYDDVGCYDTELAEYVIKGREIRNSITAARKLAQCKGKKI
ncbi:hypothetical protein DL765_002856 [Monosporascus sp. GIB2]|nr:hypothetical protein DL765_002856 [Monosporascus sp. GIB2]